MDRKQELQNEAIKIKLRYADKCFTLALELNQDLTEINRKLKELEAEEKKDTPKVK